MSLKINDPSKIASVGCELADNIIYIKCRINGSDEMWFILDSGATFSGLDILIAQKLGLDLSDKRVSEKTGMEFIKVTGITVGIGRAEFTDQFFNVMNMQHLSMFTGREIAGIIGYDIFNESAVRISYSEKTVSFREKESFIYTGNGSVIPLKIINKWPIISVEAESFAGISRKMDLIIDIGSMTSLSLNGGELASKTISTGMSMGIGGAGGAGRAGRIKKINLGGITYSNPLSAFPQEDQDSGGDGLSNAIASVSSGIIGGELLHRFDLIFDYAKGNFIIEKNMFFDDPMEYDMSGIVLLTQGAPYDEFIVYIVSENTPAFNSDIRSGDIIIEINGRPSS